MWIEMLRPVGNVLADPLEQRFMDRGSKRGAERTLAALALADYLKDDPKRLTELVLQANNDREFKPLLLALRNHRTTVVDELKSLLSQSPPDAGEQALVVRDAFWKKQAKAAVCLLELGDTESVWPLFQQTPNPSLRSFLIDWIALLGANHETLAARIKEESDPASRYALILALGQFDAENMSSQQRQKLLEQLTALYRADPDSGVHSAAGWTLRKWQQEQVASEIDDKLRNSPADKVRNWFVNSQGQTYIVVNGPVEFLMGEKTSVDKPKNVTLSHRFAIATLEVTVVQFQKFRNDHKPGAGWAPEPDCPVNDVSWYDAVAYCNWLSEQEGIPQDQWCYEKNDKGKYAGGMRIPTDYLERTGYRLPAEEEWEFVCRANSTSGYGFGEPLELLTRYAWYFNNSKNRTWPVGTKLPNGLGVFDMHGNAWEWCHNLRFGGQPDVIVKNAGFRLLRGGSAHDQSSNVLSAFRNSPPPVYRLSPTGFRPARTYNLSP
jgi:formylglycine-generating enzyme required for sulfatase activity